MATLTQQICSYKSVLIHRGAGPIFLAAPWVAAALPIVGCFAGGSLYGWSGYSAAVRAGFGVDNAAASMVFSVALVSFTVGVLLGPSLVRGMSQGYSLASLCGAAALALVAANASPTFPVFFACYGLAFGFLSGVLYNFALSLAASSPMPNVLLPVSVAAFGLGGAVFGPLSLWLADLGMGLWSTLPAGVCLAVVAVAAALGGATRSVAPATATPGRRLFQADPNTVLLWAIFAAGSCPGLVVLGFASQIVGGGAGVMIAGLALFLAAAGNTAGRLAASPVAGRFGSLRGVSLSLILSVVALFGLLLANAAEALVAWLFLAAFAYGHFAANMPLYVRAQVGPEAFPGAFGVVFTGWGVAGLAGPWAAGALLDRTGDLSISFAASAAVATLGLLLLTMQSRRSAARAEI